MKYDVNKTKRLIKQLYPSALEIEAIGHHHLIRHMVFSFVNDNKKYVIKFYFKPNKWNREVSSLKLLHELVTPTVIKYGTIEGIQYLVIEYIQSSVLSELSGFNNELIYYEAGKQVGQIHLTKKFNTFGVLEYDTTFKASFDNWSEYFKYESDRHLNNLDRFQHPNQELINNMRKKFIKMRENLKGSYDAVLTHNDFSARNILVRDNQFLTLIDFEQSSVQDPYRELAFIQYHLDKISKDLFKHFLKGYKSVNTFNERLHTKNQLLYNIHFGLAICSWSLDVDYDHYQEGVELLMKYNG